VRSPLVAATLAAALVSLGLLSPSLGFGFVVDDVPILSAIEEWYPERTNAFDVYASLIEHVVLPWWSAEDLDIAFFRPLSSALLRLDHALFGRYSPAWRVHSMLWLLVLLAGAAALYRRLPPRVAALAVLIFALDESHGFTAGWVANRHAMVAAAFGAWALAAHLRFRLEAWRPGQVLALAGLLAALAAGEVGTTFLAYAVAIEVVLARRERRFPWATLSPVVALGAAYVLFYKATGHGSNAGGIYVDPTQDPLVYLQGAFTTRLPSLLGGALAGPPPDFWLMEAYRPYLAAFGALVVLAVGVVLARSWPGLGSGHRLQLAWMSIGAGLSLLPVVATAPSVRQLLAPMVGLAPVLATLLDLAWQRWREGRRPPRIGRAVAGACGVVLVLVHFVVAPFGRVRATQAMADMHRQVDSMALEIPPYPGRGEVVLLNAPGTMVGFYGPTFHDLRAETYMGTWLYLSAAPHDHRARRTGSHSLELEVVDGEMLATSLELTWPPARPYRVGDRRELDLATIEVLELGPGGGPTRLGVSLEIPLDSPDLHLYVWGAERVRVATLPTDGTWLEIPRRRSSIVIPGAEP
ncbi:MAG: hypothetical protein MI919_38025, partial [Holophagales bacterium]|nr:hypothetical protein [Holophagales bacterium]